MPPTPPNTASRIRVHYSGFYGAHTMLFHGLLGIERANFLGDVQDIVTQMTGLQYNTTVWNAAEYAAEGSPLFFPMPEWTVITAANANGTTASDDPGKFMQFGGRDAFAGVRKKLYVFEMALPTRNDMRWNPGEHAAVDAVITELQSVDNENANIAGRIVIWNEYANVGSNDFLVHKARQ
jgi:hypothetical protein